MKRHASKTILVAALLMNFTVAFAYGLPDQAVQVPINTQPIASQSSQKTPFYADQPHIKPPYDSHEWWAKVIGLIQLHGGFIEPSEIESAFGAKVIRKANYDDAGYGADVVGPSKWFDGFSYQRYTKPYSQNGRVINDGGYLSVLIIPTVYQGQVSNYCTNPVSSEKELESMGWVVVPEGHKFHDFVNSNHIELINPSTGSTIGFAYGAGANPEVPIDSGKACILTISILGKAT